MSDTASPFVHLHVHTQYSLLDGAIRLGDLFKAVKTFDMPAVAITDHGTMFGALDFYQQAVAAEVKPIIGCECYVAPRTLADKTPLDKEGLRHLVLLAENQTGYRNLCKLATVAQMEGYYYKPRIDKTVLADHAEGLICLSACLKGDIPQHILAGNMDKAEEAALFYQQLFGEGNFFLELQHNGIPAQEKVNQGLFALHQKLSIPLVATNDCHYLNRQDAKAHEILLCVQTQKVITDRDRFVFDSDQLYFKSPEEMQASLGSYSGAIENTKAIADRCHIEFDFKTYHFPQFDPQSGKTADQLFDEMVRDGYARRMAVIREKHPDIDEAVYNDRLEYELKTIKDMGFPGYFLIVADFIGFAKENGIPVGPGRGSAAGSLVSFALFITDLDPIEHGLIFERFLNPSRISMPDIDVDFCIHGRERVYNYVVQRYGGGDYVSQIITFGKMKAKLVIRDVGRALGLPLAEVDTIAKLIPDNLKMTIDKALKEEPKLAEMVAADPRIKELIDISRALEGLSRHASTHAAGVVIGDKPLVEYLPLYKGKKGEVVTQFDMKKVEDIGLVKFDFLGLRNLTVIDNALKSIAAQGKPVPDLANLAFDDEKTYALLQSGDTTGVFQLESSGMKNLLVRLHPESFGDLTALVALYRPGPLDSGMVDDFVDRKHGRKEVVYPVDSLEPILKETYGVMVYQEQVMQVAGALAGYSMADADSLRKAIGKKIEALMAKHREKFVSGSVANGVDEKIATDLFDLIEKFGGYGFNKSHSAAYALIAYQTAYLKAHFPVEFMAALLTSEIDTIDGVVKFINECRSHGIEVLPPDINESATVFTAVDGRIRFGLAAVKNVGEAAVNLIIEEREANGPFTSIFDFCQRVDLTKVNKRVLESLIRCGALDSTGVYRSRLMAVLEEALDYGQRIQREKNSAQMSLFDMGGTQEIAINLPVIPNLEEWDDHEKLQQEKDTLGFYVTGHPLDRYRPIIEKFTNVDAISIREVADKSAVRIGGTISAAKVIRTRKEELMGFATVEDLNGSVEVVIFPSVYASCADLLTVDAAVLVQGVAQVEDNGVKILADAIIPMDAAEETWAVEVRLMVDPEATDRDTLDKVQKTLKRYPGSCRGYVHICLKDQAEAVIAMADALRIRYCDAMTREVNSLFGYAAVETRCSDAASAMRHNDLNNGRRGNGRSYDR
ncbi:DNA polymerase III subunit alpha [Desulfosarcina cetonica]|uniref:DNA polymerase III subunit alpha n=1 Tax=Desulfosarcina cetonica TaxID=90730 RepID=UPI0006CF8E5F|nr:DNA polymerase III subunit alpha [Desulfosarcina cetonica]VTR64787.1 DNA polymerase III subunit alpha [Desulfosarcina cetonica]